MRRATAVMMAKTLPATPVWHPGYPRTCVLETTSGICMVSTLPHVWEGVLSTEVRVYDKQPQRAAAKKLAL